MKGIGTILMVLSGGIGGLIGWLRLQQRVSGLRELKGRIRRLSERIRYTAEPVESVLCEIDPMLSETNFNEGRGEWEEHLSRWGEEKGLSTDDCAVLRGFVSGLGRCDVEGEIRFCEEYHAVIEERLCQAQEQLRTKGRVYPTLAIGGSIVAALLFW